MPVTTVSLPLRWVELEVAPRDHRRGVLATRYDPHACQAVVGVFRPCASATRSFVARRPDARMHDRTARQRRVASNLLTAMHLHLDDGFEAIVDLFDRCMLIFSTELLSDSVTLAHIVHARDRCIVRDATVRFLTLARPPVQPLTLRLSDVGPLFCIHTDVAADAEPPEPRSQSPSREGVATHVAAAAA